MALSDRIALLRDGGLEQVASPREIYAHPATAYAAQFIGHTNLLRAIVREGVADCGSFYFPFALPEGSALFSVRPEAIDLFANAPHTAHAVRFTASIRQQIYAGATELLELQTDSGAILRARIGASATLTGTHEFVFSASDATPVKD